MYDYYIIAFIAAPIGFPKAAAAGPIIEPARPGNIAANCCC